MIKMGHLIQQMASVVSYLRFCSGLFYPLSNPNGSVHLYIHTYTYHSNFNPLDKKMELKVLYGDSFLFNTCVAKTTSNSLPEQNICCIQGWDISVVKRVPRQQSNLVNGQNRISINENRVSGT